MVTSQFVTSLGLGLILVPLGLGFCLVGVVLVLDGLVVLDGEVAAAVAEVTARSSAVDLGVSLFS